MRWAELLQRLGRPAAARAQLELVLARDPAVVEAHLLLGVVERALGDDAKAAAAWRRVLEFAPGAERERSEAHLQLANLEPVASRSRYDHAAAAVALDPAFVAARTLLAEELARAGRYAEAAEAFEQALAHEPANVRAHFGQSMALLLGEDYPRALSSLERGTASTGGNQALEHALARLLAACPLAGLRDGARALGIAQRLIATAPTIDHAETMAMALAELGRFEEAGEWQERAIEQQRRNGDPPDPRQLARLESFRRRTPVRAPWLEWPAR